MLWIDIGVAAALLIVAALIAVRFAPRNSARFAVGVMLFIALAVPAVYFGHRHLTPKAHAALGDYSGRALFESPLLQALYVHQRELYDTLRQRAELAGPGPAAGLRFYASAIVDIGPYASTRMVHASDAAVHEFLRVSLAQLRVLEKAGGDICYRMLFPKVDGAPPLEDYLPRELLDASLPALEGVITSSFNIPQPTPRAAEVLPVLQPVLEQMVEEFGTDVKLMSTPTAPGVDRARVCAISTRLFERIHALPEERGSAILRYMLAGN
jgi:hypothetical protein